MDLQAAEILIVDDVPDPFRAALGRRHQRRPSATGQRPMERATHRRAQGQRHRHR